MATSPPGSPLPPSASALFALSSASEAVRTPVGTQTSVPSSTQKAQAAQTPTRQGLSRWESPAFATRRLFFRQRHSKLAFLCCVFAGVFCFSFSNTLAVQHKLSLSLRPEVARLISLIGGLLSPSPLLSSDLHLISLP